MKEGIRLENSIIILAGGMSKRLGNEKALLKIGEKPLILHTLDNLPKSTEKVIVVSRFEQKRKIESVVGNRVKVVIDEFEAQSPLVGALTGFKNVREEYALLISCDLPFLSWKVASFLLEVCLNRTASIPRWPNGYIEPLHAAYHVKSAEEAAEEALREGKLNMRSMIEKLGMVRYISTLVIKQLDPELLTFFNVNTPLDLKKAERILKEGRRTRSFS